MVISRDNGTHFLEYCDFVKICKIVSNFPYLNTNMVQDKLNLLL